MPRTAAVITVHVAFFALLPVLGFVRARPVFDQATAFARACPA
jgi:predicted PurR-regulated permease PerM